MDDNQFQIACGVLEDHRRLIAAGKMQRWDVVKWTVTVNIALAAAASTFDQPGAGTQLIWLATIVAFIGWALMIYYNWRLTKVRKESEKTEEYLTQLGVNFSVMRRPLTRTIDYLYDWQELFVFTLILGMSVVPVVIVSKLALAE